MSKKKIRQVRVCLKEHINDIEDIVASMCDKLSDLPDSFRHPIQEGVVYMALFDSGYHEEDFWEKVADYLIDTFTAYFESQTEFSDTLPRGRSVIMKGNRLDIRYGSTDADLMITDIASGDVEITEKVIGISDEIPHHYQWNSREDMEYTAEIVSEQVAEMFAEYDLASDDDFSELAVIIRDAVLGDHKQTDNIDRFSIDMLRKRLLVGVETGTSLLELDMSLFNRFEVDDALSIRNGSRSRRAS